MARYAQIPLEVQAWQYEGSTLSAHEVITEILKLGGHASLKDGYSVQGPDTIMIQTIHGAEEIFPTDWVVLIRDQWVKKRDAEFKADYDPLDPVELLRKRLTGDETDAIRRSKVFKGQ